MRFMNRRCTCWNVDGVDGGSGVNCAESSTRGRGYAGASVGNVAVVNPSNAFR